MPTQLHTVIIDTPHPLEMADFYSHVLEIDEPQPTGPDHYGMQMGHVYLGFDLKERTGDQASSGAISLWFEVDDLDHTYQRALEAGATDVYAPQDKPWGARLAAVCDAEGNILGLAQKGTT